MVIGSQNVLSKMSTGESLLVGLGLCVGEVDQGRGQKDVKSEFLSLCFFPHWLHVYLHCPVTIKAKKRPQKYLNGGIVTGVLNS